MNTSANANTTQRNSNPPTKKVMYWNAPVHGDSTIYLQRQDDMINYALTKVDVCNQVQCNPGCSLLQMFQFVGLGLSGQTYSLELKFLDLHVFVEYGQMPDQVTVRYTVGEFEPMQSIDVQLAEFYNAHLA